MGTVDHLRCVGRIGWNTGRNKRHLMNVPTTRYGIGRTRRDPGAGPGALPAVATLVTERPQVATPGLLVRKLPLMSALQIAALVICLAATAVAVALFAKVIGYFVGVFRLGQPDGTRTGDKGART